MSFTKNELALMAAIATDHYVKLSSKAKTEASQSLLEQGMVRVFGKDDALWAKARSRAMFDRMVELSSG